MTPSERLLKATGEFHRVYGASPKFAEVVGELHKALSAVDGIEASPGKQAVRRLQHSQITFNHAGQEPSKPSEAPGKVQEGSQRNSRTSSARGRRQGPSHSGSTARRRDG